MYDRAVSVTEGASGEGKRQNMHMLLVGTGLPAQMADGVTVAAAIASAGELNGDLLTRSRPDVVLSPLVGDRFDCFEIAERLALAGFSGRYLAFVESLPNPDMVRRELHGQFPAVRFELIVLS